jgi:TonB family protein
VQQRRNEIRFCYEKALAGAPGLGGRVTTTFTIGPMGQVNAAFVTASTLGHAAVEGCIVAAIRRWPFPAPRGGGAVIVSYPFLFVPAGGGL